MTFYCPCPCTDPVDPSDSEENTFLSLPRNLSYVQESYLDAHDVSGRFVYNPRTERRIAATNAENSCHHHHHQNQFHDLHSNGSTGGSANNTWRADGTKVEATTGGEYSSKFEGGFAKEEGDRDVERNGDVINFLSVLKSRRDPLIHFGAAAAAGETTTAPPLVSDCATATSTTAATTDASSLSKKQHCLNNNSDPPNKDTGVAPAVSRSSSLIVVTSSSILTTLSSSSSSSSSPSSSLPSSSTYSASNKNVKAPSPSTSFINKVTSLISPKNETVSDNSPHQDDLRLGSSVDDETTFEPDETAGPSQPLLLRSPDRSGLIMDRGEDLVVLSHEDLHGTATCTATTCSTTNAAPLLAPDCLDEEILVVEGRGDNTASNSVVVVENQPEMTNTITTPSGSPSSSSPFFGLYLAKSEKSENDESFVNEKSTTCGTPDSDEFVEEGVFVNMIDDTDGIEKGASEVSEDTNFSVDSMFCSPEEIEPAVEISLDNSQITPRRMSLEEAISKAASDFNKITMLMYPDVCASNAQEDFKNKPGTSKDWGKSDRLQSLAKSSLHGLSVHITDYTDSSASSEFMSNNYSPKESPIYEDHEFNFNKKSLRKSSSLKTNKTPPGTPHRKKVVRFADAMGLDLESVRHVLNMESPPKIPASAMADLKQGLNEDRVEVGSRFLTACFSQPGAADNFVNSVLLNKVKLENAIITDLTITGFIRVANVAFHKRVRVRYTHNNWATFHDIAASYMLNSCDGPTDRFSFSIVAPAYFVPGNRLEFAVSYNAEGAEFWDNNDGANYGFECFAKTVPTENDREWLHFL